MKKCIGAREKRRSLMSLNPQNMSIRKKLKAVIRDINLPIKERLEAIQRLNNKKRDTSAVRRRTRCYRCGRPRSVFKQFRLCRMCLRRAVMQGEVPGVSK